MLLKLLFFLHRRRLRRLGPQSRWSIIQSRGFTGGNASSVSILCIPVAQQHPLTKRRWLVALLLSLLGHRWWPRKFWLLLLLRRLRRAPTRLQLRWRSILGPSRRRRGHHSITSTCLLLMLTRRCGCLLLRWRRYKRRLFRLLLLLRRVRTRGRRRRRHGRLLLLLLILLVIILSLTLLLLFLLRPLLQLRLLFLLFRDRRRRRHRRYIRNCSIRRVARKSRRATLVR